MLDALLLHARCEPPSEPLFRVPEQQFALAAALRLQTSFPKVLRSGALTVLVGPPHSGKSAIARFAARQFLTQHPKTTVAWLSAGDWIAAHELALQRDQLSRLQRFCARQGLIVCDQLDEVIADTAAAQTLCHWLDRLLASDVRVLVTSRTPVSSGQAWPTRLLSRLHSGLIARLGPLSEASQRSFLEQCCAEYGLAVEAEALQWLVAQANRSPRSLSELGLRLWREFAPVEFATPASGAAAPATAPAPTVATLPAGRSTANGPSQTTLADAEPCARRRSSAGLDPGTTSEPAETIITLAELKRRWPTTASGPAIALATIASDVAHEFSVSLSDLRSPNRSQALRLPRQCAMYLAREAGWSLTAIGSYFSQRTHTAVAHSCQRLRDILADSPTLREQVARLSAVWRNDQQQPPRATG